MRATLLSPRLERGSRYKYVEMFSRVCTITDDAPDFAIVFGDGSVAYRDAIARGLPYILVEHDVASARGNGSGEREMVERAAAVLVNSEDTLAYLETHYAMPPVAVVHLRPLARDIAFSPLPKMHGRNIVYAGGIVPNAQADGKFGYRAYAREIFPALVRAGWTVHVYAARMSQRKVRDYLAAGCVIHDTVPQGDLYRELSQYQLGFQGYAATGPQEYIALARPNKLWEYLASGIPTLGFNPGGGGSLYDGRWGLVCPSLGRIGRYAVKAAAMPIDPALRASQVMDSDEGVFQWLVDCATKS